MKNDTVWTSNNGAFSGIRVILRQGPNTAVSQKMVFLFTVGGTVIFGEYVNGNMMDYNLCFPVKLS